jgi:hypothetical protein
MAFGDEVLAALRPWDLQALLDDLADAGLSHRRLAALAEAMRTLFDFAVDRGLIVRSPADHLAVPGLPALEDPLEDALEDAPPEPRRRFGRRAGAAPWRGPTAYDHVVAWGLELATVGVGLVAGILFIQSLWA